MTLRKGAGKEKEFVLGIYSQSVTVQLENVKVKKKF